MDSLLEYGTNEGNFTTVQAQGVLEAIGDFRDGDIKTLELFEVVDFFRSGEKLLNVQFEPQESPGGAAVDVTAASIASADQLSPPDEFVVGIENESGVIAESDVITNAGTNVTVDGLDLEFDIGERVNLTATLFRADNGSRGVPFQIAAGLQEPAPIQQTAEVNPLQEGLYFIDEEPSDLDVAVDAGENATVTVVTEAISEADINGTITLQSDSFATRVRAIGPAGAGAAGGEFVNESFELPTETLPAGDTLEYDVIVETDGVDIQDNEFGNVVTVQDLSLAEQAIGSSNGSDAILVENVFAEANQTVEVTDSTESVVGSVELDSPRDNESVTVPVSTTSGEHTATLRTADGDTVTSASATIFEGTIEIQDQAFTSPTDQVTVNTSNLQGDGPAEYRIVVHDQTQADNTSVDPAPDDVGPPLGSSGVLSGSKNNVTITLGQNITSTQDVLVMIHFPNVGGSRPGPAIPVLNDSAFGFGDGQAGTVTDTATVSIVNKLVEFVNSPAELTRSENASGAVTVNVTADQIGVQNTVETTVELVFEGLPGESETVLGTETVEVAAGATEQVTFSGLDPVPNATTASDSEPTTLRVETSEDNASTGTNVSQSVQSAVDFAGTQGASTVDVLAGTYDESVDVDVAGLTVTGPNAGADGASSARDPEAVVTGGLGIAADGVTVDGLQVENTDTNGVRFGPDTVPSNVTIQNSVVTDVTGSVGGKSAGNGIQFQFGNVANQTAQNIRILDNEISNITAPAASVETEATGVNVLPRGNNVDLEVDGNTFTDITAESSVNGSSEARGVALDTQDDNENGFGRVDGAVVSNNTFNAITAPGVVRAVALFEDTSLAPREGPVDVSVTQNNFTALSGATPQTTGAVFVGGYETLGTTVVTENNFESGGVLRFAETQPRFDPSVAEDLDATENWWGNETGPSGAGDGTGNPVSENVTFDPWLDAPFPQGNTVSDAGIEATITNSPSTADRPNNVSVTANVTNALNFSSQALGAPVNISLVFDDGQTTVLDTANESIVASETVTVTLSGALPGSTTTERSADYELRVEADVADDSRSGTDSANLRVSNSIRAAIDAASPGGTVDVVAGTYKKSVTVDKAVTIEGPNAGIDGATSRGPEAIVTSGLDIAADNVTVDGLQVENAGRDGIRFGPDTVPSNVTIQNSVVTDVTGAVGGKSAGNGIQFQLSNVANETAQNIRILDNEISNITTPNVTDKETIATGVNVLPRGNNVDLEVDGNTFSEITAGSSVNGSSEARGVSLDTQDDNENGFGRVDDAVVSNNTFSAITAPGVVRAVALFEDTSLAPREGPVDVSVTQNNFTALSGATPQTTGAVFVGGYETLGTTVVTENNFESGGVLRFAENQSGFTPAEADDLDATENWWGNQSGPSGAGFGVGQPVSENVTFDPWLNAPFPAGVAVSDDNINQLNFEGDSGVIAGQELAANSTIANELQVVGANADPGRPVIVEHVLLTDSESIVLANRSVNILPGGQEDVTFSSPVPERVADTTADHEIRVRDQSRGTSVSVFNGNLTFNDQQLEDDPNAPPEVVVEDVETNVNSTVVVTSESGGDLVIAGLTGVGNNSMTPENVTVTLENESGLSGDRTAHVIRNESLSQAYAPGDVVSAATAEGILDSETALVELQQAEGGNVEFQSQVLGTNNGSPAVLAENVQPVDVVTIDQAFDPQDDFLVLTDGTEVTGPNDVLDFVQLRNVSNGADVALNASGATAGQHTVVLHEPNASGTGPDPSAPRTNASTGEVVNATATVFTGSVNITDQTFQDNTSQVTVDASNLQAANPAEYVIVVHNQTGVPAGGVGPPLGSSNVQTSSRTDVPVNISEITQTTDLLAMIHFPSGSPPIPTLNNGSFGIGDGQAGTVTDTATAEIVTGQVTITDSPATANRGDDLSNDVTAEITAQEVTSNTASIEATLVFEGVAGEAETVLGSETVNLGPGDSTTVTFTGLDPIPETATAIDSVPVNLQVETLNGADTNTTDLSNPIQNAIDFADTNGLGTVDVEPGTYDESVTVDVQGLTVAGPNDGTPGDSDARGAEAVITGGSGNTPGVQIAADNVTLDGLQVENTDTNGIRFGPDTVPSNVTIQNSVVTNVTGATGGKSAGNGIQFQFSNVANQTAENISILNNEISDISSPDTSGDSDAIGVNVLPRGNDIVNLRIANNTIETIEPGTAGGRSEARAVSVDTQFTDTPGGTRGDFGQATGLTVEDNDISNLTADFARAVNLFEDADGDTTTNDALGPVNFTITGNTVTAINSTDGSLPDLAVFVGEYGNFGADHSAQRNNFLAGVENFGGSSDTLTATENWWGNESGPAGDGPGVGPGFVLETGGSVINFDPWLDAPVPDGQPVTDGDIDVRDYVADNETVAGGTLNASATVENGLQGATTNQGRALTVEHVLLANGNRIVLNSTSVDVVPGTTETVSFVNSSIPDSVSSDSDAEHRIAVRSEFVSQNLAIEPNGSVAFNDQVLGTNASGSDAVLVEDVSTSDDAAVVVTYENNAGDLVIAGLTEIQSNNLGSEDVTVVIEDTGGFPGEHVAHLIPTSDLSTNYSAGETVSNATADSILDSETATVFDGSVTIDDQTFEDNTTTVNATASDLQPETASDYVVVVHNQTGVPAGGVGPAIGFSDNLTGAQTNATVSLTEEITQTTPLLAMIHFPSASGPAGMAIPTLNDSAFGFSDGQAGTVTDTATASIVTGQVSITDSPTTVNRTENLNGQVNATITAQEVTTSNTASIEATLVFEGVTGEGETVLGSETVDLGPGDSTTVTFDNLDPIPNATIASDGSVNLRVDVSQNNNTVSTALSHSVQNAVDFAVADNQSTVDLLAETFVEEVTIDTDNATIGGTGTGSTTIDGNVTLSGDNNTLEGFTIDGNLTITGADNDISNVTVTGQVTQNSVGTTQLPNSGVVIVQNDTTLTDVTSDAIVVQNNSNAGVSNSSTETLETETGSNTSISNSNVDTVEGGGNVSSGTDAVEVRDQNGNLTAVFNTIGVGVDNAPTNGRLVVASGTYEESVTVDVEGLTIEGPNAGTPGDSDARGAEAVITGGSGNTPGVQIAADNVTLDGLQVENTDTNGIRFGPDTVPSNVTIQNSVVTNVTGDAGGKSAGNGIQFQFGSPVDQTAQNIQILDNEISNISSPDTSGETDAIGVNVLPRGNNVDLEIRENTFTDIVAGNDTSGSGVATARAISLDTQDDNKSGFGRVDGVVISNNTFDGITADDVRAVALFEDSRLDPREGVENFSITQNRFANLTLTANTTRAGPAAVFVGGYETLGTGVVTENNIESGAVFRTSDSQIPGFDPSAAEDLNAVENWWGNQSGPSGAGPGVGNPVSENVTFDPWLDAPFPAGQPVTDGDIDVRDYVADNETVAGGTLNASATVENGLQGVTTNQGRALTVEHVLLANGNQIVLNSTSVDVVPGTTETVSFVNSSIPDSVSSDSGAEHRIEVRGESVSQNLVIEPTGSVAFNDQVLGTNASGSDAVLVEDVSTSDNATVVVTYENNTGDLVIAGLTEIQSNDLGSEDVTVVIEDTGGFPGEHVAHLIPTSDLSTNYSAGDTVSNATADSILDSETATVFDGSVTIDNQTFEDNTSQVTVNTSDLQAATPAEYVVVIHNQTDPTTGPPPSDVGPALGVSANQTGLQNNVTVNISEITQTTPLLAMIHFPSASGPAGMAIPTLNDTAFGFSDGQASTVTDTATAEIVTGQVTITDSPATVERGDNLSGQVAAEITADKITTSTASIEATLVFEGIDGEPEQVLGTETVDLGANQSETVTFTGLDPIRGNATAVDSVSANLRVETSNDADVNTTSLTNPVQKAINFADANNINTVEVEPGTYEESVTVDVAGLTVEGPNAGFDGASSARGPEGVVTSGLGITADGVTIDGLQVENTDTNGVRFGPDTVPSNVTIQNSVVTNVTGNLGGKSAGNGIQFQFSNVANETAQNIRILDNEISSITTPNATNAETIAIGVNVLPRGNDVDIEVRRNTFSGIEPGVSTTNRAEARGVSLSTQDDNLNGFGRVDGAVVTNNTFDNISAGDNVRAVALFEEDDLNPREGPVNVSVTRNKFTSLSGATPQTTGALFVGGYETLGADHVVTGNNFDSGGVLRFTNASQIGSGFNPSAAEDLNATENWWGNPSGPSGAGPGVGNPVSENVTFDPWLNAPFPAGQPVTDGVFAVENFQSAATSVQRGDTVSASVDVTNDLQAATNDRSAGDVPLEYVLINSSGGVEVIDSKTVEITPGTTETVSLSGTLSTASTVALDNETLTHRIRVATETSTAAGASLDVSHSISAAINAAESGETVTVRAGTYEESVTVGVQGLTVEPAAGASPTVVGQSSVAVSIESPDVTLSDLTIQNPQGDRGVRATDDATNVKIARNTIENVGTEGAFNQSRGILVSSLLNGDSASGLEIRNNTIDTVRGTGGNADQTIGIQILEESNGGGLIENVVVDGNTVTDLLDNRSSQGINFNGNIEGEITNNSISTLNTDRPGADLGFTQAIALNAGGNAGSAPQNVDISGNSISNLDDQTPSSESFRATHIILSSVDDVGTIDITNNEFTAVASDENYILDRASGDFDLQGALSANTFALDAVQVTDGSDRVLVPETGVPVVNVDQNTGFEQIQPAVDGANAGDTIEVDADTYNEQVTISDDGLTLEGPNAGTPADESRNNEATISGTVEIVGASGVTVDGFKIAEGSSQLTSGVSIQPGSSGANGITVTNSIIENMSAAGGGGPGDFTFGVLSFGGNLSDVTITDNRIANIGNPNVTQGVAVSLQSLTGTTAGTGATVERNTIRNISSLDSTRVGTGVALRSNFNGNDSAAVVANNSFAGLGIAVSHPQGDTATVDPTDLATVVVDDPGSMNQQRIFTLTVQNAVTAAESGDTVEVGPGTFEESVTIGVEGLTLEGPNAGIAGDSNQRGAEATITDANGRSEISAANVTIDGFNFEFGEQAIRSGGGVDSLITNSRFELTADTSDGYAIRAEESSTGIDVTDNLFTGITSNDGTGGDNANGVVVRDPDGTRIAGNNFSSVDTAVNIGSKSDDTASGTVSVEDNEFSGITQFGAVLVNNPDTSLDVDVNNNTIQSSEVGVLTFNADDQATFSIQDNDFENFSNDKEFVDDQAGVLTLDDVLKNQGNTFDPDAVVADDNLVPEVSISNWDDLDDIRENLDGGYVLVNDLNRSTAGYEDVAGPNVNNGNGFDPIGGGQNPFTGSFDGNGNTISGLVIDRPSQDFVGLFGASTGTITSVTLDQTNTTGGNFTGGLVGANGGGTVSNSSASGVVNGSGNRVGGLVGQNFGGGTVSNSSASGVVNGSGFSVGGLVGENFGGGTVSNSSASGVVNGSGFSVGGLVGDNRGTVSDSSASVVVNGSDFFTGGLVGLNLDGTVSNSEASGTVTGDQDVGGLVGDNRGTVSDSSASGDVTDSRTNVGGLVGDNDGGTVTDSSASGDVTGSSDDVGGLVGENTETATVSNSEASGNVTGSGLSGRSVNVGGLVGDNAGSVDNSSASGAVDGTSRVGGLVGDNEDTGFVDNSSASGDVIGDRSVGALFGENDGTVRNSSGSGNVTQR